MKQLTFQDVCKQLKGEKNFEGLDDKISALSGAALLLLGLQSSTVEIGFFLNALTVKNELKNIGKCVLDKLTEDKTSECEKRMNLIRWSYAVICYTAYFDVLDEQLSDVIRKAVRLSRVEKEGIFVRAMEKTGNDLNGSDRIIFPGLQWKYSDLKKWLGNLYQTMNDKLIEFVNMLAFRENYDEKEYGEFLKTVKQIPKLAMGRFEAQYLYLASHYPEFYTYLQIAEADAQRHTVEKVYEKVAEAEERLQKDLHIGFEDLKGVVRELPEQVKKEKVADIVRCLNEKYKREIETPIIESGGEVELLNYPSIGRAFIPQAYKLMRYTGEEQLEKESMWNSLPEEQDMYAFWNSYLVHPDSVDNMLLILGEPGGGKSLLTKIICARMVSEDHVFLRVPLREVNVDQDVEIIVCEQLQKDGDASETIPSFKWFAEQFKVNPITIFFDGYDEVLQATGGIYRGFLKKIERFQEHCKEMHRPVRVIVTSRTTLIDKAIIPKDSMVIRLEEFDERRVHTWIEIWNEENASIFMENGIGMFQLPKDDRNIAELSRQPLLLLMLAIYDADIENKVNSLGESDDLSRTILYNALLERFIKRELKKGARGKNALFSEIEEEEQECMVQDEMRRLGIAALGMYIRGKLSLRTGELEKDLIYMEAKTWNYEEEGNMLKQAELLFGSFFFIHDSRIGEEEGESREAAFEFLHKTFYEFLVADLILKYLTEELDRLNDLRTGRNRINYSKALGNPNQLSKQLYASLIYMFLCTEPEVLEMIYEWKDTVIAKYFQGNREEFDLTFEELLEKQLEMVCEETFMPTVWMEKSFEMPEKHSYMHACAFYFMNMIVLRAITDTKGYAVIEEARWKYLAGFWKAIIGEDLILKFTGTFAIQKEDNVIRLKRKNPEAYTKKALRLTREYELADFLQNDFLRDLLLLNMKGQSRSKKQKVRRRLDQQGVDMRADILLTDLYWWLFQGKQGKDDACEMLVFNLWGCIRDGRMDQEQMFAVCSLLNEKLESIQLNDRTKECLDEMVMTVWRKAEGSMREEFMLMVLQVAKKLGSRRVVYKMSEEGKKHFFRILKRTPAVALELLRIQDFFGENIFARKVGRYFCKNLDGLLKFPEDVLWGLIREIMYVDYDSYVELMDEMWAKVREGEYGELGDKPKMGAEMLRYAMQNGKEADLEMITGGNERQLYDVGLEWQSDMSLVLEMYADWSRKNISRKQGWKETGNYIEGWWTTPKKMIKMIKRLDQSGKQKEAEKMAGILMDNFADILCRTPDIAMDALIIALKLKSKELAVPELYVKQCLNLALFGDVGIDPGDCLLVLKLLDEDLWEKMEQYFYKRFERILLDYPEIAYEIVRMYGNTFLEGNIMEKVEKAINNQYLTKNALHCLQVRNTEA